MCHTRMRPTEAVGRNEMPFDKDFRNTKSNKMLGETFVFLTEKRKFWDQNSVKNLQLMQPKSVIANSFFE